MHLKENRGSEKEKNYVIRDGYKLHCTMSNTTFAACIYRHLQNYLV